VVADSYLVASVAQHHWSFKGSSIYFPVEVFATCTDAYSLEDYEDKFSIFYVQYGSVMHA
jgi:hypothetical protein